MCFHNFNTFVYYNGNWNCPICDAYKLPAELYLPKSPSPFVPTIYDDRLTGNQNGGTSSVNGTGHGGAETIAALKLAYRINKMEIKTLKRRIRELTKRIEFYKKMGKPSQEFLKYLNDDDNNYK